MDQTQHLYRNSSLEKDYKIQNKIEQWTNQRNNSFDYSINNQQELITSLQEKFGKILEQKSKHSLNQNKFVFFNNRIELRKSCFRYLFEEEELNDQEIAIDGLIVDHMQRTSEELQALQKATEKMEFFQRINSKKINRAEKLHQKVISQMQLKFFPKGTILFNYGQFHRFIEFNLGDKASNFFLIVKGSVNFFLPKKYEVFCDEIKIKQQQIEELKSKHYDNEKMRKLDILKIQELTPEFLGHLSVLDIDKTENMREQGINKYYFSRTLGYGQSFGELALLQRKPRSATAIVKRNAYLGYLDEKSYSKILAIVEHREMERIMTFIKEHIYRDQNCKSIQKLSNSFKKIKFKKNQAIFKQGSKIQYVYIVKAGEVLVFQHCFSLLFNFQLEKKLQIPDQNEIKSQQTIQLAKLVQGEIFGAGEIIHNDTAFRLKRKNSAICSSLEVKALKSAFLESEILQDLFQKNLIHQKQFFQEREKEIIRSLISTARFRIQLPSLSKRALLNQDNSLISNSSFVSLSQERQHFPNLIKQSLHDFVKKKKNIDNSINIYNSFDFSIDQQKDPDSSVIMIIPELEEEKQRTITLPVESTHQSKPSGLWKLPSLESPRAQDSCHRICCSLNKDYNEESHSRIVNMHTLSKKILMSHNQTQALKKLPAGSKLDSSPYFQQSENMQKVMKFIHKHHGMMFPKERDEKLKNEENLNNATQMFQALKQIDNPGNFQDQSIKFHSLLLLFLLRQQISLVKQKYAHYEKKKLSKAREDIVRDGLNYYKQIQSFSKLNSVIKSKDHIDQVFNLCSPRKTFNDKQLIKLIQQQNKELKSKKTKKEQSIYSQMKTYLKRNKKQKQIKSNRKEELVLEKIEL